MERYLSSNTEEVWRKFRDFYGLGQWFPTWRSRIPRGSREDFQGYLDGSWVLMYCCFLISHTRGKCVPIENSVLILPDLALLWCNNVKSTALPANLCECACKAAPRTAYWGFGLIVLWLRGKKVENPWFRSYLFLFKLLGYFAVVGRLAAVCKRPLRLSTYQQFKLFVFLRDLHNVSVEELWKKRPAFPNSSNIYIQ